MDFGQIINIRWHPHLAWLGRQDWLAFEPGPVPERGSTVLVLTDRLHAAPGWGEHAAPLTHLLGTIGQAAQGAIGVMWLDALAESLAYGPKLFVPSEEQFEAMQHVELHFPTACYRQAYPALIVKIPNGCRKDIAARCGLDQERCPGFLLLRHRRTHGTVFIGMSFGGNEQGIFFQDRPSAPFIEECLTRRDMQPGCDEREFAYSEWAGRAAMNLGMMLAHYGSVVSGPLNPHDHARHRARRHLAKFALGDMEVVELTQEIVVRGPSVPRGQRRDGGDPAYELNFGWRKGHWRRRPNSPADSVKSVFVNPCQVRPDRIPDGLGVGDSNVTYRGR